MIAWFMPMTGSPLDDEILTGPRGEDDLLGLLGLITLVELPCCVAS